MRVRTVAGALAAIVLAVGLSACSADKGDSMSQKPMSQSEESSEMASGSDEMQADDAKADEMKSDEMQASMMSGTFTGLNGKAVAGKVEIDGDELKLTDFSSDEGPDLHIYLTQGTDEDAVSAGKMIDKVAFDQMEQTFSLDGVDTEGFTDVVIHCDKAKAVFGAAPLS